MKQSALNRLRQYIASAEQWYLTTPDRALDQAYQAALKIKKIEDEHFAGNKIAAGYGHSNTVMAYFQTELKKHLKTCRMRLTEFRASNRFIDTAQPGVKSTTRRISQDELPATYTIETDQNAAELVAQPSQPTVSLLEKIRLVDATIARYQPNIVNASASVTRSAANGRSADELNFDSFYRSEFINDDASQPNPDTKLDSSSFIPRSILRTADRFRKELDPAQDTEEEIVKDFRASKARTRTAIRFLLLLIVIPLLTQQISKTFVIGPLVDHYRVGGQIEQVINSDIEEKIFKELNQFEERLRFQNLVGQVPALSTEKIEAQLRDRAVELSEEYKWELTEPLKNILSDALALAAFTILLLTGQRQIAILKGFMDEVVYGLSDSAKAFMIILFTDVFVGFHSPHGWTVLMENILEHFGLPQNEDFIDMFIATFPVMLDTVFKYWIFRYLNQISPSAVATYKNMNE
jgi:CemA family